MKYESLHVSYRTVWTDYLAWTMKFFHVFHTLNHAPGITEKKKNGKRSLRFIYENAHMKYRILYISLLKSGSTLSTWELTYSLYHIQKSLLTFSYTKDWNLCTSHMKNCPHMKSGILYISDMKICAVILLYKIGDCVYFTSEHIIVTILLI